MNTNLLASLLLPALTATLCAQDLTLTSSTTPQGFEFRVGGASEGSLVVLVLGSTTAEIKLPGGQLLGVQPDLVALAIADADRRTTFSDKLPLRIVDFLFFAQAAAIHPRLPLDARGGIVLSPVGRV